MEKTISKLKNDNIDLKHTIMNLNKKITKLHAEKNHLENEIVETRKKMKTALSQFESKHEKCINSIIEMVSNPNFAMLPDNERKEAVASVYKKLLIG